MLQKFLKVLLLSYFLISFSFAASTREIGFDIGTLKTQSGTPSSPASGKNKIYVKDGNLKLLDSTGAEKSIGSSSSNQELINGDFENGSAFWTITNGTPTVNTSTQIEGKQALSIALTGALSLSQSSTINAAQKSGVQMVASIWVNSTDVSDLQLCSLKNGVEDKCTVTGGYVQGSGWRQLTVSFLGNSTSNGLKLKSTDTTGTVLVDQAYVGIGSPVVDFTPDMVYSAKVSSTGVVSDENTDWISGNCTNSSATYTCPINTGIFTVTPNCSVTTIETGNTNPVIKSTSSSSQLVYVTQVSSSGADLSTGVQIICQKQGANYKTSKAYVASSSDFGYTNAGTITIGATTTAPTKGTVVTDRVWASRDGQRLKAIYQYEQSSAGTAGSGDYLFTLPSGLSFDSSVVGFQTGSQASTANSSKSVVGSARCADGATTNVGGYLIAYDATRFRVACNYASNTSFVNSGNWELSKPSAAYNFNIDAPIQGWTDSGVIVGSFQGYNETPGTSRVETFSVSYGTTNATTACSASPCSYLDQIGNAVTSVTRSSQGVYVLNLGKSYSKAKCAGNVQFGSGQNLIMNSLSCNNCSTLSFTTVNGSAATLQDTYGTLLCQGIPQ